jgi:hypothetical protein
VGIDDDVVKGHWHSLILLQRGPVRERAGGIGQSGGVRARRLSGGALDFGAPGGGQQVGAEPEEFRDALERAGGVHDHDGVGWIVEALWEIVQEGAGAFDADEVEEVESGGADLGPPGRTTRRASPSARTRSRRSARW